MSDPVTFLGWTDEVSTCDLCGKAGLKATAALEVDGEVVFYGCVCAARALSGLGLGKVTAAQVTRLTEAAHAAQVACGKAFDQGLNWEALEAAAQRTAAFRAFVATAGRAYCATLPQGSDLERHTAFHCTSNDGAYGIGLWQVFGSRVKAQAAFDAQHP